MTLSLKDKRKQWLKVLDGEDRSAIKNQVVQMAWDAAAFRVINEARRLAPCTPDGDVKLNGLVHGLLNRGFFISQMVSIRRQVDVYGLDGKKGVYSLTGLLMDVQEHQNLLTRKSIFEAENLEYDVESLRRAHDDYARAQIEKGKRAFSTPANLDWQLIERRHQDVDRLADVAPTARSPEDTILAEVFTNLLAKLKDPCLKVKDHVDKFIAHAATPESRAGVRADEAGLALNLLWESHRILCQVISFLSVHIFGGASFHPLPYPQFDQFQYIDKPLVAPDKVEGLRALWKQYENESHDWGQWGMNDYELEFAKAQAAGQASLH